MLHVGLLREKQLEVLAAFAERYLERHGPPLPRLLPEAVVQAVQPVEQDFDFHGFYAPTPLFQDGSVAQPRTFELGEPAVYHTLLYEPPFPDRIAWSGPLEIAAAGELNALRIVTKNLLAILPEEGTSVDWLMNYLIVPLEDAIEVRPGDTVQVELDYRAGAPLSSLAPVVRREVAAATRPA